jgi:hypothetical protein
MIPVMQHNADECDKLVRYLVGTPATPQVKASYARALQKVPVLFFEDQQKLWNACMKNTWILPHVDAYLGFRHPNHPIRKKIFIMLGVLETQADYTDFFLPSCGSFFDPIFIAGRGIWAVIKIFTGRVITWML